MFSNIHVVLRAQDEPLFEHVNKARRPLPTKPDKNSSNPNYDAPVRFRNSIYPEKTQKPPHSSKMSSQIEDQLIDPKSESHKKEVIRIMREAGVPKVSFRNSIYPEKTQRPTTLHIKISSRNDDQLRDPKSEFSHIKKKVIRIRREAGVPKVSFRK